MTKAAKANEVKYREFRKRCHELTKENLKVTSMVPTMQAKVQALQRNVQRAESDAKYKSEEAAMYKNQVYSLQVELEGNAARYGEEIETLKDTLMLIEGERDALKTSLKEEEVMRIAAEGHIPLPTAGSDENDEFESPIRSPRKQRNIQRDEDNKENVSPKKGVVELKFLQQELATERRLRERAQDQIDFMKMECQFQCCSCRIAENKGQTYVHDGTYAAEMQRIKMSVPITPPSSYHGHDTVEDVVIKQELVEEERPFTPSLEDLPTVKQEDYFNNQPSKSTVLVHPLDNEAEVELAYSPSTGTFRAVPSPVKASAPARAITPTEPTTEFALESMRTLASSPWTPDAHSTICPKEVEAEPAIHRTTSKGNKAAVISIHEDVFEDDEDELELEPPTPSHEPSELATPVQYQLRTTTTTIPLHFSPATPAFKAGRGPMTPSTVAHAATDARTPVLGELSLNNVPFNREAALEAIRQRRGRARSMAAGHGTPMKQMVEGAKDRRDISAPVSRARR
jgi:hypothetical protein